MDALAAARSRVVRRIAARFFVRFHMTLIFAGTVAAAVVASRILLSAGLTPMAWRYALATAIGYLVFFVLVRVWIVYVTRMSPSGPSLDVVPDLTFGSGTPSLDVAPLHTGGGGFGGAGASGDFETPLPSVSGSGGSASGGGFDLNLDLDLDDLLLVIALVALVLCLGGAALWVIWQAPVILPEAAFEALLASELVRVARRNDVGGWSRGVLRATILPFGLVLAAAVFVGWAAQRACPVATRLADLLTRCGF